MFFGDFGDSGPMQQRSGKVFETSARSDASGPAECGTFDGGAKGRWDKIAPALNAAPNDSDASFGIPEGELTPNVRKALISLFRETERLRHKVETAKARLEDVAKYADQDALLPILNRRAFVREVSRFIAFFERYGTPSCLIYIDLNSFKMVNDIYGHVAGDAVLQHFAKVILEEIRQTDIFARIGGDEFGVVLAHATLDQARRKCEKFMRALNERPPIWNDRPITLSFAPGVYKLQAGETAESAIAQADKAMYAGKRNAHRGGGPQVLADSALGNYASRNDVRQKRIFNL